MTEKAIERIEKDVKEIKDAVIGEVKNGDKIGLKGLVALNTSSIGWLQKIIFAIVGILAYVVYG